MEGLKVGAPCSQRGSHQGFGEMVRAMLEVCQEQGYPVSPRAGWTGLADTTLFLPWPQALTQSGPKASLL